MIGPSWGQIVKKGGKVMSKIREYLRDLRDALIGQSVSGKLIRLQAEYIEMLGKELSGTVAIAHLHGWRSDQVGYGNKLRMEMKKVGERRQGKKNVHSPAQQDGKSWLVERGILLKNEQKNNVHTPVSIFYITIQRHEGTYHPGWEAEGDMTKILTDLPEYLKYIRNTDKIIINAKSK